MPPSDTADTLALTGEIVSAFVAYNSLRSTELPALIQAVHTELTKIASGAAGASAPAPEPAITARTRKMAVNATVVTPPAMSAPTMPGASP